MVYFRRTPESARLGHTSYITLLSVMVWQGTDGGCGVGVVILCPGAGLDIEQLMQQACESRIMTQLQQRDLSCEHVTLPTREGHVWSGVLDQQAASQLAAHLHDCSLGRVSGAELHATVQASQLAASS